MKTRLEIRPTTGPIICGTFTDEHSASSCGIPVFIADDGRILAPEDMQEVCYANHLMLPYILSEPIVGFSNTVPIGASGGIVEGIPVEPSPEVVAWLQDYIVHSFTLPYSHRWIIPEMQRGQALLRRCEEATGRRLALNHT